MPASDPLAPAQAPTPSVADRLPAFWPHRAASRWVEAGGLAWHVQVFEGQCQPRTGAAGQAAMTGILQDTREGDASGGSDEISARGVAGGAGGVGGEGRAFDGLPRDILLLHGAGASAHSWRDIAPALAQRLPHGARVIVPDLPGHAVTGRPPDDGLSLPGMARLLHALLQVLQARPRVLIGHSAGAAVAARLALDGLGGLVSPGSEGPGSVKTLISLNGAWLPPAGQGRWFYAPLARLFALNPWVPHVFAFHASHRGPLDRLIASTGSRLDRAGIDLYARLVSDRRHVAAVLAMMTAWDLRPLLQDLPRLAPALHLVVAEGDRTVPPRTSEEAA
ncbi:MAG: alpha/beta fold hydrolase BchO, partial [Rubrivivax sp.]